MTIYCVGGKDFPSLAVALEWAAGNGYHIVHEILVTAERRFWQADHIVRAGL